MSDETPAPLPQAPKKRGRPRKHPAPEPKPEAAAPEGAAIESVGRAKSHAEEKAEQEAQQAEAARLLREEARRRERIDKLAAAGNLPGFQSEDIHARDNFIDPAKTVGRAAALHEDETLKGGGDPNRIVGVMVTAKGEGRISTGLVDSRGRDTFFPKGSTFEISEDRAKHLADQGKVAIID